MRKDLSKLFPFPLLPESFSCFWTCLHDNTLANSKNNPFLNKTYSAHSVFFFFVAEPWTGALTFLSRQLQKTPKNKNYMKTPQNIPRRARNITYPSSLLRFCSRWTLKRKMLNTYIILTLKNKQFAKRNTDRCSAYASCMHLKTSFCISFSLSEHKSSVYLLFFHKNRRNYA